MKRWGSAALGWSVACGLVFCPGIAGAQEASVPSAEPTLVGIWSAPSVTFTAENGQHKTLRSEERPVSLTVSEQQFTLRVGDTVLAEMTYRLDPHETPWTLDLKSEAGAMLGICTPTAEGVQISLNDEAQGRPSDFKPESNGMVLNLKPFRVKSLYVVEADGSQLHRLLTMPDYTHVGSPDWSRDGRRIAFDAWRSLYGEGFGQVQLLVANADGSDVKQLGPGAMPSWSPDGKQLTFTVSGMGASIMNADGTDRRSIASDVWGSQWTPNRNVIALRGYQGGENISLYDVDSGQRRPLLDRNYQQVYWALSWSPDGAWIVFKATRHDGVTEIAAVSAEGEKKGFHVLLPCPELPDVSDSNCTLSWGGDGRQILVSLAKPGEKTKQLYVLEFPEGKPKKFAGFPSEWGSADTAWSVDGKQVVFSAAPPPVSPAGKPAQR